MLGPGLKIAATLTAVAERNNTTAAVAVRATPIPLYRSSIDSPRDARSLRFYLHFFSKYFF